ncbi:MAG: hypothetical protein ACE5E1_02100 [Phycisphaerae bacterium]
MTRTPRHPRRCRDPRVLILGLGAFAAAGCAQPRETAHAVSAARGATVSAQDRATVYARTETHFASGWFYKPLDATASERTVALAPLIVQALDAAASGPRLEDRIAAIERDASGAVRYDTDRPTVYAATSQAMLHGRPYEQVVYVWWYPPRPGDHSAPAQWRGYRMTLGADGFPIIWEALGNARGPVALYVSETLEQAAAKAFGPPLPGRRHAIEHAVVERPNVVVARILADGPAPMGPFVYLTAGRKSIATLLCRCMASQVSALPESVPYRLEPLAALAAISPDGLPGVRVAPDGTVRLCHPLDGMADARWLEQVLRLPDVPREGL